MSAPGNPTKQETLSKLKDSLAKVLNVYPFNLPEFKVIVISHSQKVGTLDSLMVLSDDLAKADAALESIILKIADTLKGLLNNDQDSYNTSLVVSDSTCYFYINQRKCCHLS